MLTAPLLLGKAETSRDLLSHTDYTGLARRLMALGKQPSDLIGQGAIDLIQACDRVIDAARLQRLLDRGFLLSQALERWQSRSIWVASRADADYPRRLKKRLRENAPPLLYGCGDARLLDRGGLALVGARDADDALMAYAEQIGRLAAASSRVVVSGAAQRVDQAALHGALDAHGWAAVMLAGNLEKSVTMREFREALMNKRLVLASPFDPAADFNVDHATHRDRLVYALADMALVVDAEVGEGDTWAGAVEQLETYRFGPVYVRSNGESLQGLDALRDKGALAWPNPQDAAELDEMFSSRRDTQPASVREAADLGSVAPAEPLAASVEDVRQGFEEPARGLDRVAEGVESVSAAAGAIRPGAQSKAPQSADALHELATRLMLQLLESPKSEEQIAEALGVLPEQAKVWLTWLVDEGVVEQTADPGRYVRKG